MTVEEGPSSNCGPFRGEIIMNPSLKLVCIAVYVAFLHQGKLAICSDSGEESSTSTLQGNGGGNSADLYGDVHYAGLSYGWKIPDDESVASKELNELKKLVEDKKAWVAKVVGENKKVVTTVERFTTYEHEGEKKKKSLGSIVEVIEGQAAMKKLDEVSSFLDEAGASLEKISEAKKMVEMLSNWDDSDSLLPTAPEFADQDRFSFKELGRKHLHRLALDNKMFDDVFTILFGVKYDLIKIREGAYMLKQENELLKRRIRALEEKKEQEQAQPAQEPQALSDPSVDFALAFYVVDPADSQLKQLDESSFHYDFFRDDRLHQYKFNAATTRCVEIRHCDKQLWRYDAARDAGRHPELVSYRPGRLTIDFADHYVVYERDSENENEFSVVTEHRLKLLRVLEPPPEKSKSVMYEGGFPDGHHCIDLVQESKQAQEQPKEGEAAPAQQPDPQEQTHSGASSEPLGNLYPDGAASSFVVAEVSKPAEGTPQTGTQSALGTSVLLSEQQRPASEPIATFTGGFPASWHHPFVVDPSGQQGQASGPGPLGNLYPDAVESVVLEGAQTKPGEHSSQTYTVPKSFPILVELDSNHYTNKRCRNSVFDFELMEGSKCVEIRYIATKVDLKNPSHDPPVEVTVWKHNERSVGHPTAISFTVNRMIVHFNEAYMIFRNSWGHWVSEFS